MADDVLQQQQPTNDNEVCLVSFLFLSKYSNIEVFYFVLLFEGVGFWQEEEEEEDQGGFAEGERAGERGTGGCCACCYCCFCCGCNQ